MDCVFEKAILLNNRFTIISLLVENKIEIKQEDCFDLTKEEAHFILNFIRNKETLQDNHDGRYFIGQKTCGIFIIEREGRTLLSAYLFSREINDSFYTFLQIAYDIYTLRTCSNRTIHNRDIKIAAIRNHYNQFPTPGGMNSVDEEYQKCKIVSLSPSLKKRINFFQELFGSTEEPITISLNDVIKFIFHIGIEEHTQHLQQSVYNKMITHYQEYGSI